MRALGIDPGSRFTGYGVVERRGNQLVHVASGRLSVYTRGAPLVLRLELIYAGLTEVIAKYNPDSAGIEGIFHHRNAASALTLGHARGVAMLACKHGGLEVGEYAPTVVKKAVVGTGRADKEQVQKMVRVLLSYREEMSEDQSDAVAIAICHLQRSGVAQGSKSTRGGAWGGERR